MFEFKIWNITFSLNEPMALISMNVKLGSHSREFLFVHIEIWALNNNSNVWWLRHIVIDEVSLFTTNTSLGWASSNGDILVSKLRWKWSVLGRYFSHFFFFFIVKFTLQLAILLSGTADTFVILELIKILEDLRWFGFRSEEFVHVGESGSDAQVARKIIVFTIWELISRKIMKSIIIYWSVSGWSILGLTLDWHKWSHYNGNGTSTWKFWKHTQNTYYLFFF